MTDCNSTHFETYRAYGDNDVLLYVGKSANAIARMTGHSYNSEWYSEVRRIEIDRHSNYEDATNHEKRLIKDMQPVWNIAYVDDKKAKKNARRLRNHRATAGNRSEHAISIMDKSANYIKSEGFKASYGTALLLMISLSKLDGRIPLKERQLAEKLNCSRTTITRAINHMEANGIIVKGEYDCRSYYFLAR